jgi:hypothetical protein
MSIASRTIGFRPFFYRYRRDVLGMDEARGARRHGRGLAPRGRLSGVCGPLADEARPMTIAINGMAQDPDSEPLRSRPRVLPQALAEIRDETSVRRRQLFYCIGARTASVLNPATLRWLANASCSNAWPFTTSACVPVRERTWIDALLCSRRWTRRSFEEALGHLATPTCCSRTQTASG